MVGFPKGRCALGAACNFPTHELRPDHKCIQCSQVIHIMCGTFDFKNDRYQCKIDCRKEQHACSTTPTTSTTAPPRIPLLSPIINPAPAVEHLKTSTPAATTTTKEIKATTTSCCPKCGQHDHLRSSSKKCKFYKKCTTPSKRNHHYQ